MKPNSNGKKKLSPRSSIEQLNHDQVVSAALSALKNSDCFKGLSLRSLRKIAELSKLRTYAKRELVFQKGDRGDYLYGVIKGRLKISVQSQRGKELALSTTYPGQVGGEISVLDGGTRTTTARAMEPTTMFLVPGEQFAQLLEEEPVINAHLLRFLCRRVRQTSQQVEDVAFLSMGQRLARQLHLLASAQMENFAGRGVKVSQNDLASLVSASRQNVNSALQEWQRQGFITVFRGRIEIHDFESLFNYVERLE